MSGYQTARHERNYGCRVREFIYREHRCVTIENELLRILICADKGADILEFLYKPIDLDFMWRSRLGLRRASHFRPSSPLDTGHFREYFAGGWYEMLPNGPVPSTHRGAAFGYHGEATLLPWDYEITIDEPEQVEVRFRVRLVRIPLFVEKTMRLKRGSATLYLHERILNEAEQSVEVLWGHHPTFGPPFLAENCRVYLPACRISVAENVPPDARIAPGQIADWPLVKGRNGEMVDLSFLPGPESKTQDFVQLEGLADGWFALVNPETEAGFALRWDLEKFPVLGYWQLFRGGSDYPWYGMNYLAAFEPASALPSLSEAVGRGKALSITPGVPLETAIEATAFRSPLEVRSVEYGGRIEATASEGMRTDMKSRTRELPDSKHASSIIRYPRVDAFSNGGGITIGDDKLTGSVEAIRAELIRKVAVQTMRWKFRMWGFGESIALRGLLQANRVTRDAEPLGYVKALLRSYVGRGVAGSPEDHVAPGAELLLIYEETSERIFLEAAKKLADLHRGFPQNKHGARFHRSDLQGWRRQIWVDCMDAEAPFLARLGIVTGDERYITQAAEEITSYARLLQDKQTGLFYHGHESDCGNNGCFWARGNAWALMGLVDTLKFLPVGHHSHGELLERLLRLCRSLSTYQHEDGLWHTVLNHRETYLESTLAVMAAVALREAFGSGFLDEREFGPVERHARAAAIKLIDQDGALALVSDATPIGNLKMYATRPTGVFPWGQGPLLLMLTQL